MLKPHEICIHLSYWLETVTDDFAKQGDPGVRAATAHEVLERMGSVGLPAYDDVHPFKHVIETGSPHARYAITEQTSAGWQIDLRSVPYDFEPMALLALQRNRPDWAIALRTGRMA